jgi:regulatory protein
MKNELSSHKSATQALSLLQKLCSRSEKCVADVQKKLTDWSVPAGDAPAIIRKLQVQGFVDEARYARAFVRDKNKLEHWGILKIKQALHAKKIPAPIITEALQEIDEEKYSSELAHLLKRKNATLQAMPAAERQVKLLRFALSRGYEYSLAYELVADL